MRIATLIAATMVVSACAHQPERKPVEAQQALNPAAQLQESARPPLPDSVRETLRPSAFETRNASEQLLAEPRFSVNANGIAAAEFFGGLAADSPYNIVVHPEVSGTITVSLKEVTLMETLDVISDIYGYDIKHERRMIRVFPAGLRTETIALDYLALQRMGLSQTRVSSGGVKDNDDQNGLYGGGTYNNALLGNQGGLAGQGNLANRGLNGMNNGMQTNGSSISTQSETDLWGDLKEIVQGIVGEGDGRRVVVSPQAGLVTVTALPGELRAAREFLATAQERLQRQVILEARIVEVALNDNYQQGINWSDLFSLGNANGSIGFSGGSVSGTNGVFGMSLDVGDFSGVLNLLQDQGNVQVLSNPRVSASNNQKAVIKIGEDEYFVTDVSTTTVTGTATTSTPNIELTPFFSGISLDITPQISDNGEVILHVHPSVVETTEQNKTITLNQESFILPLAQSNIRESDTIVRARNGEIVVLGGLMQTSYTDNESKAPVLGDIPVVGNLFKNKRRTEQKKELVILIRPVVVGVDTWKQELERSSDLLKRWYNE
ncbi:pilus (MSHA type) biogenesis protein MshL [Pseudidiomarina terrestris]|uniref:Pilus (MSHA type) biogenesis protein MshL n=1 Tax=Pseudidiomarina terrestris TaxID=2820060 RepID=A0ABT8MHM2_9GAMM|nr:MULTISPECIES: pilus (MSHA type) biogenesis protein MshL [unclassified Pseudidiomarina]MDN7129442.1 pilus (MSHA type) biogenesis protein MshL [Pseudidiomarina sp. 1APR75-15]MDN7134293.1 pilus (MSHA type) biogenesis protein MshL [Pseudidiomarina sp. 1ASP75-5]MDN7137019.1 pilus (MSHA type) biogenesis protein MshL [Pseudidiomarina sp. 1ASP75-14]